jgi:hypothetical protein
MGAASPSSPSVIIREIRAIRGRRVRLCAQVAASQWHARCCLFYASYVEKIAKKLKKTVDMQAEGGQKCRPMQENCKGKMFKKS